MTGKTIIQDNQIAFRRTTEADLELVMMMEGDDNNAPYIRLWSIEQHRYAIADKNIAHLTVLSVPDSEILGYIILVGLENSDRSIEFKRIVINNKGVGLGRASVRLVKKFAFKNLGAHRLWLEVMEHNHRALELYESEGFIVEGVHRESLKQGDRFFSLQVMSMLAQEYDSREGGGTTSKA